MVMEDIDITIDDFPMPGDIKPGFPRNGCSETSKSEVIDMPMFEHYFRYSSPLPAEYHDIIVREAAAHGFSDLEDHTSLTDVHLLRAEDLDDQTYQPNPHDFRYLTATKERRSEEQITCNDFLRESYPPSLIDASHSSSSDESVPSGTTSFEYPISRELRNSSSTLMPIRQRWRISGHRQSHDSRDGQSKSIDSSKLYRRLRENLRGASLRPHTSRSSSTSSGSQEALHSLQRCSEKNPTMLNLQEVQISEPTYARSTLEFCEEKISTWPCGSALQKSLINELSLDPHTSGETVSCRHFEYSARQNGGNRASFMDHETSRFSWSTIYTVYEEEKEEALSWRKKFFKRPKGRPKIPEWLTGHDS